MPTPKYSRPIIIGVRQVPTGAPISFDDLMINLGRNSGNMMFTHSLTTVLANARLGSYQLKDEELEGHDSIVIAAANWVNEFDDFGWLADRLESTSLPVFLVGLGAQADSSHAIPAVSAGTLKLLSLVQERSTGIAARGHFSCEVLNKFGIKAVEATGCPSLLLLGPAGPQARLEQDVSFDAPAIHSTRHARGAIDSFQTYLYQQAYKHRYDIVLQSEQPDINIVLDDVANSEISERYYAMIEDSYGADRASVSDYLRSHGRFFSCYDDWINYARSRSFCLGTRIHGTIASLIAGTPAVLIAHDARTSEMANIMSVPHVSPQTIATDKDLNFSEIYSAQAAANFRTGYAKYYSNYLSYFDKMGIAVDPQYRI